MELTKQKFEELINLTKRSAVEYHNPKYYQYYGVTFDKTKNTIILMAATHVIEISNIKINDISEDKPFFNCMFNEFTPMPFQIAPLLEEMGPMNFIGRVQYPAPNLFDILLKAEKEVIENKTRMVFVQGFVQKGTAPAKLSLIDGAIGLNLKSGVLRVHPKSHLQADTLIPGETYMCAIISEGDEKYLDVISKFGKARAGLLITDGVFDPAWIPSINALEKIDAALTTSSNKVDIMPNEIIPPIHIDGAILYDTLKVFAFIQNPMIEMHFQRESAAPVMFQNNPQNDDEPQIKVFIAPLDQSYGYQRR